MVEWESGREKTEDHGFPEQTGGPDGAVIMIRRFLDGLPWSLVIVGCLTLGLAPFFPPHIWEKLVMLAKGQLVRPLDWFDLIYHGIPWVLLVFKAVPAVMKRR